MSSLRFWLLACVAVLAVATQGCAGGSNGTGTGGSAGGSGGTTGAAGSAGTSGSAGTTGAGGTTGVAGTTGSAGTTGVAGTTGAGGGSAGATGAGGSAGATGAGGSAGATGTGGSGGSAGAAGRGGSGGSAGSGGSSSRGGTTGTGGSGGNTTPHGSAAKFICPQGQTYGNPIPASPTVNQIAAPSGSFFAFIEGPVWIGGLATLFFSDNASGPERIWKLVPPSTTPTIFVPGSGSNGLAVDNNDQIVAADQSSTRRIVRFNPMTGAAGTAIMVGTNIKPNDLIVRSDDNIYFTDPATGFYRISAGGTVSAAMKNMNSGQPNGIVLSPDENTLYVGDQGANAIYKYALAADGTVMTATGAVFAMAQTGHNTVDGMCLDCAGNVYAGTSGGVEVYSPTGSYIGTVNTGESSNCTFGGADRKTMYVTSRSVLKYVTLAVPGLPN